MKYSYTERTSSKEDAFNNVCSAITKEYLSSLEFDAEKKCNKDALLIEVCGSGFSIKLYFKELEVEVDIDLSFMLRPFKSKLIDGLKQEFGKVL